MPPLIGLLVTRNEADVIKEVMEEYSKHFDAIFAFDSSDDGTFEIIKSFPNVVYAGKDLFLKEGPPIIKDGIRQVLLEKAQKMFGYDGWIFSLQGDEIFHGDVRAFVESAGEGVNRLNCLVAYFIMHTSERETVHYEDCSLPVQDRRLFYFLTFPENCAYKNEKGIYFDLYEHMRIIPHGGSEPVWSDTMIIRKHYPMRDPFQWVLRRQDRVQRGWQPNYDGIPTFISDPREIHREGHVYSDIMKFDGTFHLGERGKHLKIFGENVTL